MLDRRLPASRDTAARPRHHRDRCGL